MSSDASERILDGRSWGEFCETLKRAGDVVLRDGSPHDAFDRAEGFRYLSRLTRVALESYIEFADPRAPAFRRRPRSRGSLRRLQRNRQGRIHAISRQDPACRIRQAQEQL